MKLFLYSLAISSKQAQALGNLVGKKPSDISFALIENAADVVSNAQEWLGGFRDMLGCAGFNLELVDLRLWRGKQDELRAKLAVKDVIWLGGGNTFYLRWILKATGADKIIRDVIEDGKVYAGWSAGAVVAGPTLQYFETMDDIEESPEIIWDGLHLTTTVVVPHLDNKDFTMEATIANEQLRAAGYSTVFLNDHQALIIDGDRQMVV